MQLIVWKYLSILRNFQLHISTEDRGLKTVLMSSHVVEQLLSSMIPSILTFEFELILG